MLAGENCLNFDDWLFSPTDTKRKKEGERNLPLLSSSSQIFPSLVFILLLCFDETPLVRNYFLTVSIPENRTVLGQGRQLFMLGLFGCCRLDLYSIRHLYTWDMASCSPSLTAKQRGSPSQRVSDPIQRELHAVWDRGSDRAGPGSSLPCSPVLDQAALPADRPAGPRRRLPPGILTSELFSGQRPQSPARLVTGRYWWHEGRMEQSTRRSSNQKQWVSDRDTASFSEEVWD